MTATPDKHMPFAARALLAALHKLHSGELTLHLPDGTTRRYVGVAAGPKAELTVKDWSLFSRMLRGGDMAFAEAYMDGLCDTPDLAALLTMAAANQDHIEATLQASWWRRTLWRLLHLRRDNSRQGARRNISAHYDLGNEFYALWLDPGMTYSSALYEGEERRSLEAAQSAKYARILDRLGVRQGDTILEIGCGWGGFAEMAAQRGARVKAITISQRQHDHASQRMVEADLAHAVDIDFRDYRDVEGRFDHIVSIEMIEAVGERYWPDYFAALRRHLKPGGKALVQVITIADKAFAQYRRGTDFIQRHVFPGGMLLSPAKIEEQAHRAGLRLADAYAFGKDYARTLAAWLERFDAMRDKVRGMGFDDRFMRMWRYYLAYCIAGFATGRTDVLQAELVHA